MRALLLEDTTTGPAIGKVAEPVAANGTAVVRIKAAALNHRELWICRGQYPGMTLPATLGADGSGTVEAVGSDSDKEWVGRDVVLYPGLGWGDDPRYPDKAFGLLGMPGPGTIAEQIAVPVANLFDKPAHLDFGGAAALSLAGLTAWRGLVSKAGLKSGERLLVTGVGGGVGLQALDFGVAMGAEVWVTSSSDDTIALAIKRGAAGGVNYKSEGWNKQLARAAGPIDVVFDGAPASSYASYGRALAMGARVVVYGSTGGLSFPVSAPEMFLKNISIIGTNVGNASEFAAMLKFSTEHALEPLVERRFSLADAAEALGYLGDNHAAGKVVIDGVA